MTKKKKKKIFRSGISWGTMFWSMLYFFKYKISNLKNLKFFVAFIPCSTCKNNSLKIIEKMERIKPLQIHILKMFETLVTTDVVLQLQESGIEIKKNTDLEQKTVTIITKNDKIHTFFTNLGYGSYTENFTFYVHLVKKKHLLDLQKCENLKNYPYKIKKEYTKFKKYIKYSLMFASSFYKPLIKILSCCEEIDKTNLEILIKFVNKYVSQKYKLEDTDIQNINKSEVQELLSSRLYESDCSCI